MWLSSVSEIYAVLDWEASMGGNSGFASLFVVLFDSQCMAIIWLSTVYTKCHGALGWGLP